MVIPKSSALRAYMVLLALGVIFVLTLPPSTDMLHILRISLNEYRALIVTLLVPYAIIWFSAFYAYDNLEQYALKLRTAQEGEAFKKIADGVRVLAWGLVIPTLIGFVLNAIESVWPQFQPANIILSHYITLVIPLFGFTLISNGTRQLNDIMHIRPSQLGIRILVLIYILLGVFFAHFVILSHNADPKAYYLSIYPLLITIVIPYLYAWVIGLLAAYELRLYARKVKGVLYQQALAYVAGGLAVVILDSVIVQYVTGSFNGVGRSSFGELLLLVYGLFVVQAVGFIIMALGAKRLKRIEEV